MTKKAPKKACHLCGEEKHLIEFSISRKHIDGLSSRCRDCCKKNRKLSTIDQIRQHQRKIGDLDSFKTPRFPEFSFDRYLD